jgi:hypothetical protein
MVVTPPISRPFMILVGADERTPAQLVDATRGMLERHLDSAKTGVELATLKLASTIGNGHLLTGTLTGPELAVHDALSAIMQLGTTPPRAEEDGLPVGPGTSPTIG